MEIIEISIKEEFIKLDSALKLANIVSSGGMAKMVIQNGEVKVNEEICLQRGKKLRLGDKAEYDGKALIIKNAGN